MLLKLRTLLVVATLSASLVHATTLLALDVPALTKGSSVVARATVRSVETRWTKDGGRIMTDTVLEVTEPWKGTPSRQVIVMQPGGVIGDVGQLVHGTAKFKVGEDVVVFLEPRGAGAAGSAGGAAGAGPDRFLLTGMLQGKFKVERSSDGKAVFARQELEGDAMLVDPATRQNVAPNATVLPLDTLRAQVLAAAGTKAPTEPAVTPPVKVTP